MVGLSLPGPREITHLAARVASELRALPTPSAELEFRAALAAVFGASVQLVARKRGTREHASTGRLRALFPERNGVIFGLHSEMAALLAEGRSQLPDVQRDDAEALARVYPPEVWQPSSAGGVTTLQLKVQPGRIHLPPGDCDRLLLLRFGCVHTGGGPSTISLSVEGHELYHLRSWLSESYLCTARLPASSEPQAVAVECRADGDYPDAGLVVYVASLVPLRQILHP